HAQLHDQGPDRGDPQARGLHRRVGRGRRPGGQEPRGVAQVRPDPGALDRRDQAVSKPGLRVYAKKDNLPRVLGGLGIAIISTSAGLMTDKQANKRGVGGEVLAYVW